MKIFSSFLYITVPFLILTLSGCSEQQQQTQQKTPPPLPVHVITVTNKNVPIWARYTGKTKASSSQEVRTRVSGILEKRFFKDGQLVKKGEKLFQIEQAEYKATLALAQAKKAQDKAALLLAQADVKRYTPLVQEGLAPRATLEQYQAKAASLKAALLGDDAQIAQAKLNLNYTVIKAPISGRIGVRYVDVGNLVGKGEATLLTTIVKSDPLYAYFSPSQDDVRIFEKYKEKEKPDAFIELEGTTHNIRLNGYVDFANNIVDPLTSTITMRATIHNPKNEILPGTFVYVNIFITDKHKFIMIPPEIIFNDQLGKYLYVVDANNTLKRANITTGYDNRFYISVKEGLQDGDKVVVSALMKLKPNLKVTPTDVTQTEGIDAIIEKNHLIPTQQESH